MSEIELVAGDETGCAAVREMIPDYVAARASADGIALVEGHVSKCADCRAELDMVRMLYASRPEAPQIPAGLLELVTRGAVTGRSPRAWWGLSAAAIAALALGIGIGSERSPEPIPAFAREAEEGEIWVSGDGLVAGAPALEDLTDEALLQLLDDLSSNSSGGAA
jgi:hypothetical protein